jgi:hypothetical protein
MNRQMNRTDDLYIIGTAFLLRHLFFPLAARDENDRMLSCVENGWICSQLVP